MANDIIVVVNEELASLKEKGFNIPGASVITAKPPLFKPVLRIVEINVKEGSQDIYPVTGGKHALAFTAIKRFIDAGRIEFDSPQVKIDKDLEVVEAFVRGSRFDIEGTVRFQCDGKSIDLNAREVEITETYRKKAEYMSKKERWTAERTENYIALNVRGYMIQLKKFAVERAISGAQARVVSKLLGMKQAYTLEELQRPFVIISVVPDIDMEDTRIKEIVSLNALGLRDALYPTGAGFPALPLVQASPKAIPAQIVETSKASSTAGLPQLADFREFSERRQRTILDTLSSRKGMPLPKPATDLTAVELINWYEQLVAA